MDSFNIHNYFKRGKTVVLTLRQGDEETRQWADKDVADLLKLMREFHLEFQNPRRKKKEVWDDVANELYKAGYTWSSEDCRKKWSNMIRTFRGIEEQRNDPAYNNKRLKWPLYDAMLQLLTLENGDAFPEASTVIQMLNSDPNRSSVSSSFSRKMSPYRKLDAFNTKSSFPAQHHHQVQSIQSTQFLDSRNRDRDDDDSINLVSEADLMEMGVSLSGHHDSLTTDVQTGVVNGMESSIIFTQPTRYATTQPDLLVPSSSSSATASTSLASSVTKTTLAVRPKKKPLLSSKRKKNLKNNKVEDSMDTVLAKFIESTNKQNEEMLTKMSAFHDNALELMRERNELLRDIRDSLQSCETGDHSNESLVNVCHGHHDRHSLDEDPQNTLTLHIGPTFSIASNEHEHTSSSTQLNPTLVLSNSNVAPPSTISSFQLEDGTVLSGIDATQDKGVLSNLGSFTQSVLPDVSLLHPGLVSVVTETGEHSSADMALAMQNASAVLGRIKQSSD